jgi:hypothetical protein
VQGLVYIIDRVLLPADTTMVPPSYLAALTLDRAFQTAALAVRAAWRRSPGVTQCCVQLERPAQY